MKKTLLAYFAVSIVSLAISAFSHAQRLNNRPGDGSNAGYDTENRNESIQTDNVSTGLRITELNIKVVRSFVRDYKHATDAKWFPVADKFIIYFTDDGSKARVLYDKRGSHLWMIREYSEDKLPFIIRDQVKSTYYDYNIYHVNELNAGGKTSYFIKLEGKTTWKIVRLVDGEMDVIEDFLKG